MSLYYVLNRLRNRGPKLPRCRLPARSRKRGSGISLSLFLRTPRTAGLHPPPSLQHNRFHGPGKSPGKILSGAANVKCKVQPSKPVELRTKGTKTRVPIRRNWQFPQRSLGILRNFGAGRSTHVQAQKAHESRLDSRHTREDTAGRRVVRGVRRSRACSSIVACFNLS